MRQRLRPATFVDQEWLRSTSECRGVQEPCKGAGYWVGGCMSSWQVGRLAGVVGTHKTWAQHASAERGGAARAWTLGCPNSSACPSKKPAVKGIKKQHTLHPPWAPGRRIGSQRPRHQPPSSRPPPPAPPPVPPSRPPPRPQGPAVRRTALLAALLQLCAASLGSRTAHRTTRSTSHQQSRAGRCTPAAAGGGERACLPSLAHCMHALTGWPQS